MTYHRPRDDIKLLQAWALVLCRASRDALDQGFYHEALDMAEKSRNAREEAYGPDHALTLESALHSIRAQRSLGDFNGAERRFYDLHIRCKKVLGQEHSLCYKLIEDLAIMHIFKNNLETAETLLSKVQLGRKVTCESLADRIDAIGTEANLAIIHRELGLASAENEFEQVLKDCEHQLGSDHPETLVVQVELATTYLQQERYEEAEGLFGQVYKSCARVLRPNHPLTVSCKANLATTYAYRNKWREAEVLCREVLDIRTRTLCPKHPDILDCRESLDTISSVLKQQQRRKVRRRKPRV
ncbi:hypothetical protein Micbo1qcDRAFT_128494 [Microdochium bolleyi]|uniref:Tetratricopeptide repeat-domain-containing protein n=1 Tax=Microdochium bolleyi TaxID=196109 RepID=A0A136IJL7_9PEZI|nr:hypothetical protein Micbo1qcDRAFT_128494 [Microdochium bolleyi]